MSAIDDRLERIVKTPLRHLERLFTELSESMSQYADSLELEAGDLDGDERFARIIMMVHSRGIATGMETAASELAKAREIARDSVEEVRSR